MPFFILKVECTHLNTVFINYGLNALTVNFTLDKLVSDKREISFPGTEKFSLKFECVLTFKNIGVFIMKKLIAGLAVLASVASFAGTKVVWVRGSSASEVQEKMERKVDEIQRRRRLPGCEGAKVYAASGPSMSYRVNRFGELQKTWTATIKVSCRNDN